MNREEIKDYINSHPEGHLQKARRKGYICPFCGNGNGTSGDGLTQDRTGHFKCFKCGFYGDMIELIAKENGIADGGSREAFDAARRAYNLDYETPTPADYRPAVKITEQEPEPDYTAFFKEAAAHLGETDYYKRRGISEETARQFGLGFAREWRHPKATSAPPSPRLIIPVSNSSYIARDTRETIPAEAQGYTKMQAGRKATFNRVALQIGGPVFVTEGEFDALSVLEAGRPAVAISSTARAGAFLQELEKQRPAGPLVLCLDKDGPGADALQKLEDGLKALGLAYISADITGGSKDPNEALQKDRAAFIAAVERAYIEAGELGNTEKKDYIASSVGHQLQGFIDRIKTQAPPIPADGWPGLNEALGGGFYPGLYVIGAISSLGKTTWGLQLVNGFAKTGRDVLIFSLEMSADELTAKSISRITRQLEATKGNAANPRNAKTTRGILDYSRYWTYSSEEQELIQAAIEQHQRDTLGKLWIFEGVGLYGVDEIRETVERHITFTGKKPIVFIDYLQILSPSNPQASDKQNTDKAVLELKRLSRKHGLTVIAISSLNRDNYTAPINMAAFKESGAVEYGSDVLIGLQYNGFDYRDDETDGQRQKRVRTLKREQESKGNSGQAMEIQVKVLKNRNGKKGEEQIMNFYPLFNLFEEQ